MPVRDTDVTDPGAPRRGRPVVVARALRDLSASGAEDVGAGLRRAGWATTAWRLLVRPGTHPWLPGWRYGRASASRIALATAALLLFAAWALSGCGAATVNLPRLQLDAPAGRGLCETVRSGKHELRPVRGVERFQLTFERVPTAPGSRGRLLISPGKAKDAAIVKRGDTALSPDGFDAGGPTLTVTLEPAHGRWPDEPVIEVRLEVAAPKLGEALQSLLRAAAEDAARIERRWEVQSNRPAGGMDAHALDELAGCQADSLKAAAEKVRAAVDALDAARAALYAHRRDGVAEAEAARKAWSEAREAVAAAAREAGIAAEWPKLEPGEAGPYRFAAEHIVQLERIGRALAEPADREEAALWLAYALAPESRFEERRRKLPPLRSIDDAVTRQAWKGIARGSPMAVPLGREQKQRDWLKSCTALLSRQPDDDEPRRSALSFRFATVPQRPAGTSCLGARSAVPDPATAVASLRGWLAMKDRIVIRSAEEIPAASAKAQCAQILFCGEVQIDAAPLFFVEPGASLKPVRDRLREVREHTPREISPAVKKELDVEASQLFCSIVGDRSLPSHLGSLSQYKALVSGARDLFAWAPAQTPCGISAPRLRSRLRQRWLELLSRAGNDERLCPSRSGICPARIASRVQSLFGLPRDRLAAPVDEGSDLESPPPFGFIKPFVEKVRRCKMCEELADVRRAIPGSDLAGEECPVEEEEVAVQSSMEIGAPGEVGSVELPGCDLSVAVKLKLRLKRGAGRVVSIVSPRPFRLNDKPVAEKRLHAQLGWAYVRTGDIDDAALFADREARLHPTEPGQKFFFLSLRTQAY